MTGFGSCHGSLDGFVITHFAKKDHIRALAQCGAQGYQIAFCICADLTLADNTFIMAVQVFQRIFQSDDMSFPGVVDPVYDTCHGGGFTASSRACDQNHAFGEISCGHYFFRDMENIQNLSVDYSVTNLRNPDGTCSILAVLSTKEFIMSYVNLFKEAKIDLEVIDLVQNCLIKLMKRFKSLQGKTYAVFILDKNMLMQCLFSNDNFVMTRRSRILAEPEDPGFEREIGQNINSIIQFNKSEQTGSDITEFYLSGFPDAAVPLFPRFEENFHVQVRTFPEYTPAEITLPENMRPAEYCILLGSLIRYSN